jgi:hypothetical protein
MASVSRMHRDLKDLFEASMLEILLPNREDNLREKETDKMKQPKG